ncbi:MAG: helix-turn-helix domain-containing protein [Nanoarchaeota archaeon]|nr:helix-turn-helix domain-containing protein [Nanoarchaeota archaeon]
MIVKEEFLNKLRQLFVLNLYEVRIWTALLSRGVSTAGELSEIANVPRSRTYDVLESLEKKGFIVMKLGKPLNYIAVEPQEVVERSKKLLKQDAKIQVKKLDGLKGGELIKELNTLYTQGIEFIEPSDLSGALRGRHNVYTHMDTMLKNAKESVNIMTSAEGLVRKGDLLKNSLQALAKKGVEIKIAAPLNQECASIAKELMEFAKVKSTKDISARFCVIDGKEVMFMVMDDKEVHPTYDVGIWVNTPFFASALNEMFNTAWKDMKDGGASIKGLK